MDFVHASTFRRPADISVAGLPATPGGRRDVYLYVEDLDLPPFVASVPPPPAESPEKATGARMTASAGNAASNARPRPTGARAPSPGQVVHAFYDTGLRPSIGGTTQTSFGYQVRHEGPLEGWVTETLGAAPIGNSRSHYVVSAPDGGAAKITTVIEAVEPRQFSLGVGLGPAVSSWSRTGFPGLATSGTDSGISFAADLEAMVAGPLALGVGVGQLHLVDPKGPHTDALRLTAQARLYWQGLRFRPYLAAGGGSYRAWPGGSAGGAFGGAGLQWLATHSVALEGALHVHVAGGRPDVKWAELLMGARWRF
jgi:hypothetical protein